MNISFEDSSLGMIEAPIQGKNLASILSYSALMSDIYPVLCKSICYCKNY